MRRPAILLAALATALAGPLSGAATAHDDPAAVTEFIGRLVEMRGVGAPPCEPRELCLDTIFLVTLEPVEHVSGREFTAPVTMRLVQHGQYLPDVLLRVRAHDTGGEHWEVVSRSIVGRAERVPAPLD